MSPRRGGPAWSSSMDELWTPLQCQACLSPVLVMQIPPGWIDPHLYVCGQCQSDLKQEVPPEDQGQQMSLLSSPISEQPEYDPNMAAIPF